jgi:hypothetical protein
VLTPLQAQRVVIWSIHAISGKKASPGQKLRTAGLPDDERVNAMKAVVVVSEQNGVRYYEHEIDPAALDDVGPEARVDEVARLVQDNATPQGE